MPIHFLYGRRESLTAKSEAYKKTVRRYLETLGFSQSTDSFVEGTFEDMTFYNPTTSPGKRFVVEVKAGRMTLTSFEFAKEIVKYFRLWNSRRPNERFEFRLFVQDAIKPETWEAIFSEGSNIHAVNKWCNWYNSKCSQENEVPLSPQEVVDVAEFFGESDVTVANSQRLENAIEEKEDKSSTSISRLAQNLLEFVDKRKAPIMKSSEMILNILPIELPEYCCACKSSADSKTEIYEGLKGKLIPPFIWRRESHIMMSFVKFDQDNVLTQYAVGPETGLPTLQLRSENPVLCSELVNVHLRRIIWNRGVYRDGKAEIFYFPMLDPSKTERMVLGPKKKKRWVVRKYLHTRDTKYGMKGETNFLFHRGLELDTPTYWGESYCELTPRKYYTFDGRTPIDGEIRKKLDEKFRNPLFDRCKTRIGLMKFWKFVLFESKKFEIEQEKWFDSFHFGDFIKMKVDWSPVVIERSQTRLWDFGGKL